MEVFEKSQESAELVKGNPGRLQTIKEAGAVLQDQGMKPETMVAIYLTPRITSVLT